MVDITVETHALILHEGEDIVEELFRNIRNGNLMTKLNADSFKRMTINNLKFVKMVDAHEAGHKAGKSIWVEVTVTF